MKMMRVLAEAPPSLRWRWGKLVTDLVYRRAFRSIGRGSVIVRPLILRGVERMSLGGDCAIYEGAWLAAESGGNLLIGDGVYLGHDVHVHAVDDVTIEADSMVADGAYIGSGMHSRHRLSEVYGTGPITIGRGSFIGQRAIILGGVHIGEGAVVGAGSVVTRDVPGGSTVAGVPARIIADAAADGRAGHEGVSQ